ncbi:hypothetical protein ATKI12_6928 [Kitasatospora sp. Ki12]
MFGIGGLWAGQRRAWDGLPAPVPWWAQHRPDWATTEIDCMRIRRRASGQESSDQDRGHRAGDRSGEHAAVRPGSVD